MFTVEGQASLAEKRRPLDYVVRPMPARHPRGGRCKHAWAAESFEVVPRRGCLAARASLQQLQEAPPRTTRTTAPGAQ